MKILFNEKTLRHNVNSDIEGPYRIAEFKSKLRNCNPSVNGEDFLTLVHTQRYVDFVKASCEHGGVLAEVEINSDTYEATSVSVGLAVQAAEENAFAVTRPPGHHASKSTAMGFCLFNNMAIATSHLLRQNKRVCILDIDGHHGNGTQDVFFKKDGVLYASIHQENSFPGTARKPEILRHKGELSTVNIPIPAGSGDAVLIESTLKIVSLMKEFSPDVIGVSAGFDGYHSDKLLNLKFTEKGFYEVGKILHKMDVPKFAVLEGGYHDRVVACIESLVAGIDGKPLSHAF